MRPRVLISDVFGPDSHPPTPPPANEMENAISIECCCPCLLFPNCECDASKPPLSLMILKASEEYYYTKHILTKEFPYRIQIHVSTTYTESCSYHPL